MNLNLFIARRLYRDKGGDVRRVSRPAILIATAGVAIGLAVMIISVCVVLGFKQDIRSKVIGFGSHIQVLDYGSLSTNMLRPIAVSPSFLEDVRQTPGVRQVQRYSNKNGILKTDEEFKGILLHGVGEDFDSSFVAANLIEGRIPQFSAERATNEILISSQMARELHLTTGSRVFAYFFEGSVRARRFTVAGIYRTNLSEFDKVFVFTDLYTCNRLNNWEQEQCSGLEVSVDDFDYVDNVAASLNRTINLKAESQETSCSVLTIRDLYPQIFAWLDLLDMNVWVILILMVAVAGFTMISGLLIIILERTNFIGVMKALGATNRSMRRIFLYFAVFVLGKGLLWGNLLGIGLVALQHFTGIFRLDAETYYVDTVPVLFNPWLVLAINAATLLISVCVLIVPSFLISNIHPAKSIRFE